MANKKFNCLDCKRNTSAIGEFYFIKTELWINIVGSNKGMLCIGCLENRIGRRLIPSDFTKCYINNPKHNKTMSQRLLNRLGLTQ